MLESDKIKAWIGRWLICLVLKWNIRDAKAINGTIKMTFLHSLTLLHLHDVHWIRGKWTQLDKMCFAVWSWYAGTSWILRSQSSSQWPKSPLMLFIFSFNKTKSICCTGAKPGLTGNSWFRSTRDFGLVSNSFIIFLFPLSCDEVL